MCNAGDRRYQPPAQCAHQSSRPAGPTHRPWRGARFALVTSRDQLLELGEVARRPQLRKYIVPARVGRFINDLRALAEVVSRLPHVDRSRDPADNFLLAMAQASGADYLATGYKRDLLVLQTHDRTRIVTARQLLDVLNR